MAKQFDPELSGTLGKNHKQATQKEGAPGYRGKCQIGGVVYWMSAWVKDGKHPDSGEPEKFFSISFDKADAEYQPKRAGRDADDRDPPPRQRGAPADFDNDDIPF